MLKGNVMIELHNHRTGLRDRIEGENSITDALQDTINYIIASGRGVPSPICQNLLGGILLMDEQLNDDINVPYNARIIGSGYYNGASTDSNIVGSYNGIESGYNEEQLTYTQVYDFSTSQANGTIKSVGLTNNVCGRYPFLFTMSAINPYINYSNTKIILYIDENDLYYVLASTGEIYKVVGYNFKTIRLNDTLNAIPDGVPIGKTVSVPSQIVMYYDGYDGYVYYFRYSSGKLYMSRIKVSDYSFTEQADYKNFTIAITDRSSCIAVDMNNGFIYTIGTGNNELKLYKIEESSGEITTIDLSNLVYNIYGIFMQENGSLYIQVQAVRNGSTVGIRMNGNGDIGYDFTMGTSIINRDILSGYEKGVVRISSGYTIYGAVQLLMSNYNLQETITKTDNQSMKVTYTLRMVSA